MFDIEKMPIYIRRLLFVVVFLKYTFLLESDDMKEIIGNEAFLTNCESRVQILVQIFIGLCMNDLFLS